MGIAAHLGVLLDVPTFGVAKQKLTGVFQKPGLERGSIEPLLVPNPASLWASLSASLSAASTRCCRFS